jgi:hypothetical protein
MVEVGRTEDQMDELMHWVIRGYCKMGVEK